MPSNKEEVVDEEGRVDPQLCKKDRETLKNLSEATKELSSKLETSSITTSDRQLDIENRLSSLESKLNILIGIFGAIGAPTMIVVIRLFLKSFMGV